MRKCKLTIAIFAGPEHCAFRGGKRVAGFREAFAQGDVHRRAYCGPFEIFITHESSIAALLGDQPTSRSTTYAPANCVGGSVFATFPSKRETHIRILAPFAILADVNGGELHSYARTESKATELWHAVIGELRRSYA